MQPAPLPTLLLTRPAAASARFAAEVAARFPSLPVVIAPLIEVVPVPFRPGVPAAGLVFTSAEGAAHFAAGDPRRGLPAFCVGERTAAVARRLGFAAEAAAGDAAALVADLLARRPSGPLLHARGVHAQGEIARRLSAGGVPTAEIVVYDQRARPPDGAATALLAGTAPVLLALFSPRSAALAAAAAAGAAAPLCLVAISRAALAAWGAAGGPAAARVELADRPAAEAMLDALGRLLAAAARA